MFPFSKRLGFACNQCGSCCKNNQVPLNHCDIARLVSLGKVPEDFVSCSPVETPNQDALLLRGGYVELYLKVERQGDEPHCCVFLKENSCTVHSERPTPCQIWPFSQKQNGKLKIAPEHLMQYELECDKTPFRESRQIQQAIEQNLREYRQFRELVQRWNSQVRGALKAQQFKPLMRFLLVDLDEHSSRFAWAEQFPSYKRP